MAKRDVFSTFHSHKIHLLAFLGLLQTNMTDFPTLSLLRFARTIVNLFSRVLRENLGNEVVEQLWFNYVILAFVFYVQDSSRANQLPCQSCCIEVISLGHFSLRTMSRSPTSWAVFLLLVSTLSPIKGQ